MILDGWRYNKDIYWPLRFAMSFFLATLLLGLQTYGEGMDTIFFKIENCKNLLLFINQFTRDSNIEKEKKKKRRRLYWVSWPVQGYTESFPPLFAVSSSCSAPVDLLTDVPDSALTASSVYWNDYTGRGPANSRLSGARWSAATNDLNQWMMVCDVVVYVLFELWHQL